MNFVNCIKILVRAVNVLIRLLKNGITGKQSTQLATKDVMIEFH